MTNRMTGCLTAALLAAFTLAAPAQAEQRPFRAVMNIELQVLDPHTTTATVTRAFSYMVYDMLVSMDSQGRFHPQMLDSWKTSDDRLTWTFTLRPGLTWHDGNPVTAEDCVASLRRWAKTDGFGKRLMSATQDLRVLDANSFELKLSRPFAFVIEAIGKPNAILPVMMPARMAANPPAKQNVEVTGSGPFTFKRDEWRPGDRAIFRRNPAYKPRPEPADGLAGGKVVHLDVVELVSMPDPATKVAALQTDAIDYLEILPIDYVELMRKDPKIKVIRQPPMAQITGGLSINNLTPPFNDVRMRKALQAALVQSEIMAGLGLPSDMYLPFCQSVFLCGGPYQSTDGTDALRNPGAEKARALLKEAGYNNERIVLLHSTDSAMINPIALVVIDQLKQAGFNLDVVASDYSSQAQRRLRKEPADQGGWNLMPVVWSGYDMINPLSHYATSYSCGGTYPGWNCDPDMPALVARFEVEPDPAKRQELAREMQVRVLDQAPQIFLGQFAPPTAYRASLQGVLQNGMHVFWNIRRSE
ncbi:MAG: ABC transporter substrate-binding protein [Acetobacteraceae bacterium]